MSGEVDKAKHQAKRAKDGAEEASESKTLEVVARFGWAANGLMHLLIGFIALRLSLGASGEADQAGALSQLASTPGGAFLLWAGLIACAALALWQLSDAPRSATASLKPRRSGANGSRQHAWQSSSPSSASRSASMP